MMMLLPTSFFAQNLVSNGDFEVMTACPVFPGEIASCTNWRSYSKNTPDYFACTSSIYVAAPRNFFGYQQPASGNAYMGIVTYELRSAYKEYLAAPITTLTIKQRYEVSMSVSLANDAGYAKSSLGVWFYEDGPLTTTGTTDIGVTPQASFVSYGAIKDTAKWVRLSAKFTADRPYKQMVIGDFDAIANDTAPKVGNRSIYVYYYIDSVVLRVANSIMMETKGQTLCLGDTLKVPFEIFDSTEFKPNNIFTLQLSDSVDSFRHPVILGAFTGRQSNMFVYPLTSAFVPGRYLMRIRSTDANDSSYIVNLMVGKYPQQVTVSSNSPLCSGDKLVLRATTPTPDVTYDWQGPDNHTGHTATDSITNVQVSATGKYSIRASIFGCAVSDSLTAIIRQSPPQIDATGNVPICAYDTLRMNAPDSTAGLSWIWKGPNNFTGSTPFVTIPDVTTGSTGKYYIQTTTGNGCYSNDSIDVLVKPSPPRPTANVAATVCAGDTLFLRVKGGIDPAASYIWTGPGITINGADTYVPFITTGASGAFVITAAIDGCIRKDSTQVEVRRSPVKPVVSSNSPLYLGDTLRLHHSNPEAGVTNRWTGPSNFFSADPNPILQKVTANNAGTYFLTATLEGCTAAALELVTIERNPDSTALILYPNANDGNFSIRVSTLRDQDVPLSITGSNGQLIYTTTIPTQKKLLNAQLHLKDVLASGVYTLHVSTDAETFHIRFVVDRR